MIFFGTKAKMVSGQVIELPPCPSCENKEFVTFGIIRYFHLYWIPTFITSKKVGVECVHCKKTMLGKEIPLDLAKQIKSSVFTKGQSLPLFTGLFIIAVLGILLAKSVHQNNLNEAEYIQYPANNDIYIVDFKKLFPNSDADYKYGLLKIKSIVSGEIEFQVGNMVYNKRSGLTKDISSNKTSRDSYYDDEPYYVDVDKLKKMKGLGIIDSIKRQ